MTIAQQIVEFCRKNDIHFAFAESCTGGKLSAAIVDVPGASDVFHGSLVTYSDGMKLSVLDINPYALGRLTAVSKQVAAEMAEGAHHNLLNAVEWTREPESLFTVSTTGYVGPYSGNEPRIAYIAVLVDPARRLVEDEGGVVHEISFKTDNRQANQQAVVERALQEIVTHIIK